MGIIAKRDNTKLLDAIRELSEYLGEDVIATAMNTGNSVYLVAEEWERRRPRTREEIQEFYRTAHAYLWNLTFGNYGIPHQLKWQVLARAHSDGKHVLDIGAGIGSMLLACANAQSRTHADVGGVLMDYARWRYARRGFNVFTRQLEGDYFTRDPLGGLQFDLVICTEVIEHVPEPERLAAYIASHIAPGGKAILTVSFEDDHGLYPCHLNTDKYKNEDFEERIFPSLGLRQVALDLYVKEVKE